MSGQEGIEALARALRETGLLGCGCCTGPEAYDGDGCPIDEEYGGKDHTYLDGCWYDVDRDILIARAAVAHLTAALRDQP